MTKTSKKTSQAKTYSRRKIIKRFGLNEGEARLILAYTRGDKHLTRQIAGQLRSN